MRLRQRDLPRPADLGQDDMAHEAFEAGGGEHGAESVRVLRQAQHERCLEMRQITNIRSS